MNEDVKKIKAVMTIDGTDSLLSIRNLSGDDYLPLVNRVISLVGVSYEPKMVKWVKDGIIEILSSVSLPMILLSHNKIITGDVIDVYTLNAEAFAPTLGPCGGVIYIPVTYVKTDEVAVPLETTPDTVTSNYNEETNTVQIGAMTNGVGKVIWESSVQPGRRVACDLKHITGA